LKRRDGDVLALACRGVSTALSARYISGLEARREQHELILHHLHPTVPSYAATNPLTQAKTAGVLATDSEPMFTEVFC
jgi:hypothetical protein